MNSDDKRDILRNVATYRELCRQIRKKSGGTLFSGFLILTIWFTIYGQNMQRGVRDIFGLIYLGLATFEILTGLLNRFRPAVEGILLDGLLTMAFGGANILRYFMAPRPDLISLLIGGWFIFSAFTVIRSYFDLTRRFSFRPTAEHLRWFDGLLREVREADPEVDETAIDLPSTPPVRGKLLGDTALFLTAHSDGLIIAARKDVQLRRIAGIQQGRTHGLLEVENYSLGIFPLDAWNWRNYAKWKTEGGEPPADEIETLPVESDME